MKRPIIKVTAMLLAISLLSAGCIGQSASGTGSTTTTGTGTTTGTASSTTTTTTLDASGITTGLQTMLGSDTTTTTMTIPTLPAGSNSSDDSIKNLGDIYPGQGELNVVEYGVDNTGTYDMTAILRYMHNTGNPIYYPNGTYLFNGDTLNFSGGVRFQSKKGVLIRNSISDTPIVNFDDNGNLIGLMHNHLELKYSDSDFRNVGNLVSPPLSKKKYVTSVDFLPYWYNDFGRACTLTGGFGWKGWYDWQWNHHDCHTIREGYDPYDPALHPLLGFYRGDEPEVLDWQCYWLQEYGIKQSALIASSLNISNWKDPACGTHWLYELLNNVPNAKQMKFTMQFYAPDSFSLTEATYDAKWTTACNEFYFNKNYRDMVYCYEEGGKRYPIVFIWNENAMRYNLGHDLSKVVAQYKQYAEAFKDNGYDGICIFARTVHARLTDQTTLLAELDAAGVKWFSAEYTQNSAGSGSTYGERVSNFTKLTNQKILYGVATGLNTHDPHPSQWNCPGTSPKLFGQWVQKAVAATLAEPARTDIITCYNVSEWSEGGPGLVPTVADRFGYLEAIRDAIVVN